MAAGHLALALAALTPQAPGQLDAAVPEPRQAPVNVLLILTDDTGLDMFGCYGVDTAPPTPNIDALASGGCRFDAAFSNPLCSPTRAQILTGRHAWRTGVGSNIEYVETYGLPLQEVAIPEALRPYGYSTGAFGKWHVVSIPTQGPQHPNHVGFDEYAGSVGNLAKRINGPNNGDYYDWELLHNGFTTDLVDEYATTKVTDLAIDWCETATEPWFAYVPYNAPHAPWHYPPDELHTQDLSGNPGDDPALFGRAAMEACDTEIGRLVRSIRAHARDPVLVFVVGDNGTAKALALPPLDPDHAKGSLYDGGTRVPLIVNGPGIPAGRTTEGLVSVTDLFATVLEAAGVSLLPGVADDSRSFLGLARGTDTTPVREYVYAERFDPNGTTGAKTGFHRMLRDTRWKLIRRKGAPDELYYLPDDPLEATNLLDAALSAEARAAWVRLQRDLPDVGYF